MPEMDQQIVPVVLVFAALQAVSPLAVLACSKTFTRALDL